MDGGGQGLINRAALVDGRAEHVHDAAKCGLAHRHHDGFCGVGHQHAAAQAVGRAQRNRAHHAVTQLLLDFKRQGRALHFQGVIDVGHLVARKFHVNHGADTLDDLALYLRHDGYLLNSLDSVERLLQTAAAPATISESSFVIAAWRVLL
ncbi:hypothetical protein FQZ97_1027450 [compost metagenome]